MRVTVSGTPRAVPPADRPKLRVMSLRTTPLSFSTFTPFEPSPGKGPAVSSGISAHADAGGEAEGGADADGFPSAVQPTSGTSPAPAISRIILRRASTGRSWARPRSCSCGPSSWRPFMTRRYERRARRSTGPRLSSRCRFPGAGYRPGRPAALGTLAPMYGYDQTAGPQAQYAPPQQPMSGGYGQQPPLYPEPSPPSLADAVRAFTTGQMAAEDFQQVFATSKVYCPRGDNPGFLALHNTQQPVIPMFSTLKELRRYAGKESKYFVITGAEVLDLLPTGYGFVLDMEGEHRMVFDAKAVEQMVEFAMRRMYG